MYVCVCIHTHIYMQDRRRKSLVLNCSKKWRLHRERLQLCDIKRETTRRFHFSCRSSLFSVFFHLIFTFPLFFFRTSVCFFFHLLRMDVSFGFFFLLFFFFHCWMKQCTRERGKELKVRSCRSVAEVKYGPSPCPFLWQ